MTSQADDRCTAPLRIAVLGATGSIGLNTLEVIASDPQRWQVVALSAHTQTDVLLEQACRWRPRWVLATDPAAAEKTDWSRLPRECELRIGAEAVADVVRRDEVQLVVAAMVGSAGLRSTWAAVEAKKTIALANKESLVVAGPLLMDLARQTGSRILPVDSEHSAIFQALQAGQPKEVAKVVLTASGGAFRKHTQAQLEQVTVAEALAHPTWKMGPKITVDCATMMNKALEIIEARWLFDLSADQIAAVVHPQSVIHSFVEFCDGSVVAQLSPPDMKLPIQYALSYPDRFAGPAARLDWTKTWQLDFEPIDPVRFPAVALGIEVARLGGTAGAVVNAANEWAVAQFLAGSIRFVDIVPACRQVLARHELVERPTLAQILAAERWAREEVTRWIGN